MMAIVGPTIRPLAPADIAIVVEFSLRAWAPVFESFRSVLGERVYQALFPDWTTSQARDRLNRSLLRVLKPSLDVIC
jgi:hypothetical protein